MYSKEETARLKQQFWITFGKYMKPIPSAEGLPINWINYKTGVKNIYFRMNADQYKVSISIEITHSDEIIRQVYFEQLEAFKNILKDHVGEEWEWSNEATNQGLSVSKVEKSIVGLNVFNQQHWPEIISFLKPRMIFLDAFWNDVKPVFETLG
jgi:hypothetical protein